MAGVVEDTVAGLPPVCVEAHRKYVLSLGREKDTFEYCVTEHLRMSGVYWALGAMEILGSGELMDRPEVADWVLSCAHDDGGFLGNSGHDPHLLYTTSAVQLLAMCGALDRLDADKTAAYVKALQQPDGSFAGDKWGEIDTRFSYCALLTLAIIDRLHAIDVPRACDFVMSCYNFDHGFGAVPGAESHAGQIFCCIGALAIGGQLSRVDVDQLGWWLAERQCDSGGLNGRPEKQADVCYSWWILSVLAMIDKLHWIDRPKLVKFILQCQDQETGGIADRPGNVVDVFHTFFGLCGLSLLGHLEGAGLESHVAVNPVFALPQPVVDRLRLSAQVVKGDAFVTVAAEARA